MAKRLVHPLKRFWSGCLVLLAASLAAAALAAITGYAAGQRTEPPPETQVDQALVKALRQAGFTGRIESTLEQRLGRRINQQLAEIGRMLWFDTITGLNDDNTCGGCHSPTAGFGDTQSIAIGIENNGVVGPNRTGPRNMRRSPMVINTAFYPNLMWNSRFQALSGSPFDNSVGWQFPAPEGLSLSHQPHLLSAQAFIPPTERTEVTGFHFTGDNNAIRVEVLNRLNNTPGYRKLFGKVFPEVKAGGPITFEMFGLAIAEFEFTLTFANAPIDRFARGEYDAMTRDEKEGALLFFGEARCSVCHSVAGQSNEMFSDFKQHVIGVPQIAPQITNNAFDGAGANEDFGLEQITGSPDDRYMFRTSPLRNVALQPTFMHNGAFTRLEDAVRYHLNATESAQNYFPSAQKLDADLSGPTGPMDPVLERLDPVLAEPIELNEMQVAQLITFVRNGLLDPRAKPENLQRLVPHNVPSGRPLLLFEFP